MQCNEQWHLRLIHIVPHINHDRRVYSMQRKYKNAKSNPNKAEINILFNYVHSCL